MSTEANRRAFIGGSDARIIAQSTAITSDRNLRCRHRRPGLSADAARRISPSSPHNHAASVRRAHAMRTTSSSPSPDR